MLFDRLEIDTLGRPVVAPSLSGRLVMLMQSVGSARGKLSLLAGSVKVERTVVVPVAIDPVPKKSSIESSIGVDSNANYDYLTNPTTAVETGQ